MRLIGALAAATAVFVTTAAAAPYSVAPKPLEDGALDGFIACVPTQCMGIYGEAMAHPEQNKAASELAQCLRRNPCAVKEEDSIADRSRPSDRRRRYHPGPARSQTAAVPSLQRGELTYGAAKPARYPFEAGYDGAALRDFTDPGAY